MRLFPLFILQCTYDSGMLAVLEHRYLRVNIGSGSVYRQYKYLLFENVCCTSAYLKYYMIAAIQFVRFC